MMFVQHPLPVEWRGLRTVQKFVQDSHFLNMERSPLALHAKAAALYSEARRVASQFRTCKETPRMKALAAADKPLQTLCPRGGRSLTNALASSFTSSPPSTACSKPFSRARPTVGYSSSTCLRAARSSSCTIRSNAMASALARLSPSHSMPCK